jgi:sortase A
LAVGLVLVLCGVGMIGYVAWQYWGTNIISKHRQQEITQDLLKTWSNEASGREGAGVAGVDSRETALGDALALVRIPRFGDGYVVPVIEGVGDDELASGFGHYPETAMPGKIGNFAIAGHRVTHGEPFRDLPDMRPGDEVVVETADAVFTYVLDTDPNDLVVQPDDTWVLDPVPGESPDTKPDQARITLTTCAELFHTTDRMIAFGHLEETQRKAR